MSSLLEKTTSSFSALYCLEIIEHSIIVHTIVHILNTTVDFHRVAAILNRLWQVSILTIHRTSL